jgi:hypothetical protein
MSGFDLANYVTVAERMRKFYSIYPDGSLQMDPPQFMEVGGKTWILCRAYAYRTGEDPRPGIGTAWEIVPGLTPYTRGSEVQNGETSAWGRALGALGIGIDKGIATADEVRAARSREGAWEKTTQSDPHWYTDQADNYTPPTGPAGRAAARRTLTEKQTKLLFAKLAQFRVPSDNAVQVINTIMQAQGKPTIDSVSELTSAGLDLVIQHLPETVMTVEEYIEGETQ